MDEVKTNPLSLAEFRKSVAETSEDDYDDCMMNLYKQYPPVPSKMWENPDKKDLKSNNRYTNVLPYKEHRVELEGSTVLDTYINASNVQPEASCKGAKACYIAAQAPIPPTQPTWWRMVWEKNVSIIVCLTGLVEGNRRKADQYWPSLEEKTKAYGDYTCTTTEEADKGDKLVLRSFTLQKAGGEEARQVLQLHYTGWPDHGVPREFDSFLNVFQQYRALRSATSKSEMPVEGPPFIVHCSAGIGRTGTFIALDQMLDDLAVARKTETGWKEPTVDVFRVALSMRHQRPGMIQTRDQYEFVHKFLDHCLDNNLLGVSKDWSS